VIDRVTEGKFSLPIINWSRLIRGVDPYLVLLLILTLFALTPLFSPDYFYDAHDGRHGVFYVSMFNEAIQDGAWWPRWAMHHGQGYGYPTFIIQAPLAFYTAQFFITLGAGITQSVKLVWAVSFLASAWGMYALVRHWLVTLAAERVDTAQFTHHASRITHCASLASLIAGLLYVFIPYRLLDVYIRAALAETLLMAWFPWVFLAFDRLIVRGAEDGWQGRLLVAALSLAGLLLTHVFSILAFPPLLIAFILFRLWTVWRGGEEATNESGASLADERPTTSDTHHAPRTTYHVPRNPQFAIRNLPAIRNLQSALPTTHLLLRILLTGFAGIAALLLAAGFIVPLLAEGHLLEQEAYTRNTYHYELHWIYWSQFFSPFWGHGYSDDPVGANDGMGFQVGLIPLVLGIAGIYLLFVRGEAILPVRRLTVFLLVISVAVLFVMTPAAAPLWQAVPILSVVQFPWRLLALAAFTFSALGGVVIWVLLSSGGRSGANMSSLLVLALIVVFATVQYVHPASLQPIEAWREDGRAVIQFEQEHDDMIGYTRQTEEKFTLSPLSPQYAAPEFSYDQLQRVALLSGKGEVLSHYSRGHSYGGEVLMQSSGTVQIRVYEYPGWQVRVNGMPVEHRVSPPYGLIEFDLPAGKHRIDMRMGSTPLRTASMAVSMATFCLLAGLWGWRRRRQSTPLN
jgi:hypothetical protein